MVGETMGNAQDNRYDVRWGDGVVSKGIGLNSIRSPQLRPRPPPPAPPQPQQRYPQQQHYPQQQQQQQQQLQQQVFPAAAAAAAGAAVAGARAAAVAAGVDVGVDVPAWCMGPGVKRYDGASGRCICEGKNRK